MRKTITFLCVLLLSVGMQYVNNFPLMREDVLYVQTRQGKFKMAVTS